MRMPLLHYPGVSVLFPLQSGDSGMGHGFCGKGGWTVAFEGGWEGDEGGESLAYPPRLSPGPPESISRW